MTLPCKCPDPGVSLSQGTLACALNTNTDCLVPDNFTMTTLTWRQFSDRHVYGCLCVNSAGMSEM